MKLRDHPQLQTRGRSMWPPLWNKLDELDPSINGEVGVLRFIHSNLRASLKCYIVIEHDTHNYVGELTFSNKVFADKIVTSLRGNIGRSIKEIGDSDIA